MPTTLRAAVHRQDDLPLDAPQWNSTFRDLTLVNARDNSCD